MTVAQPACLAHCRAGVVTALLLIWVSVAWMHAVAAAQPGRVVAIGDIHGAAGQFGALLETLGLTDSSQRWTGGRTTLVQTGDFTDRGAGVKIVLDLLMRLETEASAAGGRVIVLLGNHETMNLLANLQDVSPDLWASFETPRSERRREEAYDAYVGFMGARAEVLGPLLPDPLPRAVWMAAHPPGFFEYMDALGPDGTYGRWLLEKQVVARVGDSILLHGGLHPTKSPADLSELNEKVRTEVATYYQYRERLVEKGLILPFFTFQETTTAVQQELEYWVERVAPTGPPAPNRSVSLSRDDRELVTMLIEMGDMRSWSVIDNDAGGPVGPLWFRGFARWEGDEGLPLARSLTERYGVTRIVVNTHYKATLIAEHLADRPGVVLSPETVRLETGGGVRNALPLLGDDPFYVINSDAVWLNGPTPALTRLARAWNDADRDALMLLQRTVAVRGEVGRGDYLLDSEGRAERRRDHAVAPYLFAGIQILHPRLFDGAPDGAFSLNLLYDRAEEADRLRKRNNAMHRTTIVPAADDQKRFNQSGLVQAELIHRRAVNRHPRPRHS